MQRNGARGARNRTKRTGISLAHASNPGAPLGCRSFRPRRQDGGWQRTPPHHDWQQELKKHTAGTGTRRFFTRKYRLIPGVSSDARGQRERQNGSSSIQTGQDKEGNRRQTTSVSNLCVGTKRVQLWLCGQNSGIFRRKRGEGGGGLRWGPGRAGDTAEMFGADIAGIFAPAVAAV